MIEYIELRTLGEQQSCLVAVRRVLEPRCDHANSLEIVCEGARCVACGENFTERQLNLMIESARALR